MSSIKLSKKKLPEENGKKTSSKKSSAKSKSSGVAVDINSRREFYKDQASKMTKIAAVGVGCMIVSVGSVFYAITTESKNVYFALKKDKTLIDLIALSKPNHKDAAVANWLSNALVDTFDFSYFNMKKHLNTSTMRYYTDNGRKELLSALKKSGNFDAVISKKLIVGLSVDAVPLVAKKGNVSFTQNYLWKLEVPATLTFRTESQVFTNKVLFTITVARKSLLENSEGLGIARMVMEIQRK